jgi:hypothetical protein
MSTAIEGVKNVVLVHGGFVDGSGWQGVYGDRGQGQSRRLCVAAESRCDADREGRDQRGLGDAVATESHNEILQDHSRPDAGAIYGAIDMPWAKLVGQIAQAYGK